MARHSPVSYTHLEVYKRQAHARGMAVLPWTVNDPVIFGDLADIGADGVVTDLPDEMLAL